VRINWGSERHRNVSFFEELKRRNVIRVAGLYVVGSWLIVQVATTILPMFESLTWLPRATVILLAISTTCRTSALKHKKESDAALAELVKKFGTSWPYNVAYVYAWRGEKGLAFKDLDIAHNEQDPGLSDVAAEPFFHNIRDDARWLPMMRKLGKAPEHLAAIKFDVKVPTT